MRKVAAIKDTNSKIKRVMLYDGGIGAYLYLYNKKEDGPCILDHWYESLAEAESLCKECYGIAPVDWKEIPDPQTGCKPDLINPTPN